MEGFRTSKAATKEVMGICALEKPLLSRAIASKFDPLALGLALGCTRQPAFAHQLNV
jgi:hypothetical protein